METILVVGIGEIPHELRHRLELKHPNAEVVHVQSLDDLTEKERGVVLLRHERPEPPNFNDLIMSIENHKLEMPFMPKSRHSAKGHEKPYKFHR